MDCGALSGALLRDYDPPSPSHLVKALVLPTARPMRLLCGIVNMSFVHRPKPSHNVNHTHYS